MLNPRALFLKYREPEINSKRPDNLPSGSDGVKDTKTSLEWIAGPDRDTTWSEARFWVQNLSVDGGGWRMPTMNELKTLYQKGDITILAKYHRKLGLGTQRIHESIAFFH